MDIALEHLGKRFRYEWIFRNLQADLHAGERWAILGPNGSGKSTLLKILSGHLSPTKGQARFSRLDKLVEPDAVYHHMAYAAPYIELIEEFTLEEALLFHSRLKPLVAGLDASRLAELLELPNAAKKPLRTFSSGMKQRVKLALAICSNTPLLLLDEPTTNLDKTATLWFHQLLNRFAADRLIVIATNEQADVEGCGHFLDIRDYKK